MEDRLEQKCLACSMGILKPHADTSKVECEECGFILNRFLNRKKHQAGYTITGTGTISFWSGNYYEFT